VQRGVVADERVAHFRMLLPQSRPLDIGGQSVTVPTAASQRGSAGNATCRPSCVRAPPHTTSCDVELTPEEGVDLPTRESHSV
jgi:hypothetical protein